MGLLNGLKALTGDKKKKIESKVKKAKKVVKKKAKKIKKIKKQVKRKIVKKVKKTKPKLKKKIKTKLKKKAKAKKAVKKPKKVAKKKVVKKAKIKKPKKIRLEPPKPMSKAHAQKLIARKDAVEFIKKVAGEEGLQVFSYLIKIGKEIDEFTLADKVNLQINFVRSLLYKLYEQKLVSFSRERDKKKGWFIYSWVAHPKRLKEILLIEKDEEIAKLKEQALDVQQVFYCESCDKSYSYESAIENMFFCPLCGNPLIALESNKIKEKINHKIVKILKEKQELEEI